MKKLTFGKKLTAAALVASLLLGCATPEIKPEATAITQARTMIAAGKTEEGIAHLQAASKASPGDLELRTAYFRLRDNVVAQALGTAESARLQPGPDAFDRADQAYRAALSFDPTNARALAGLESLKADRRHATIVADAEALAARDPAKARDKAQEVLVENANHVGARAVMRRVEAQEAKVASAGPQLGKAMKKPVTLEFRDAPLRSVFELLSKHTGLNFVFDRDIQPDLRTSIFVKNTSVEEAIRLLMVSNQLERKVLNENTILVYPNNAGKQRDYKDLVMKSFYLSNADAKQTAAMIRSLVKTRDIHVDEKLNLVVMRDTPEAVRMAEKLVTNQDLGEPEVMLEVEVLEVGANLLSQLGVQWPSQVNLGIMGAGGIAGTITGKEARGINSGLFRLSISDPLVSLNLKKQDGSTSVLANPRIRVKNKEKAKVHIGDKVPVITSTSTATGFVSESVNYLDVGLKLEVEPTVFLENDVAIKVSLEVSNIAREIRNSATGSVAYQVGTRNAATTLRLKDGETQVLAGLINDEDRRSANKVPGLGDTPGLDKLFGNHAKTANKTEIVLLITPRVVRNLARPEARLEEFNTGPEGQGGGGMDFGGPSVGNAGGNIGTTGGNPAPFNPTQTPSPAPAPAPAAPQTPASGAPMDGKAKQ